MCVCVDNSDVVGYENRRDYSLVLIKLYIYIYTIYTSIVVSLMAPLETSPRLKLIAFILVRVYMYIFR